MVLIISEIDDYSTNEVIDWLRFYKMNFVRISRNDKINFHKILLSNYNNDIEFYINNDKFKLSDFKAFWYRRSHMIFSFEEIVGNNSLIKQINAHLSTEAKELGDYFKSYISERSINKYDDIYFNKLKTLKIASEVGLVIPKSIVTKCKNELIKFRDESKNVITKNFSQGVFIFKKIMHFIALLRSLQMKF